MIACTEAKPLKYKKQAPLHVGLAETRAPTH